MTDNKVEMADLLPLPSAPSLLIENNKKVKNVILRAPILTSSGYGVHARQVARWLFEQLDSREDLKLFIEPLNWGVTPWIVNTDKYDGLIGRMVQHVKQAEHYDVSIQLQLPNEWNPFLADYNIGLTAAVETDCCPKEWVGNANQMDMVIVPSEFVKNTFTNTGTITTKLVVVPEAFTDACLDSNKETVKTTTLSQLEKIDTEFNFLVFGQFCGNNPDNDRKNLAYTIKWLSEVFKDQTNIGVIIKTNFGRNTKLDRVNTVNALAKILLEVKQGTGPKFYLLHGDMKDEEVAALYRSPKVKALLSLSRGEGFGLPLLEAAACGLPVISTNWSAPTEFLGLGKYIKVDYTLGPIHNSRVDNKIFFANQKWAHPDEADAKRKVEKFLKSPSMPQQWARELAEKLQNAYSFKKISEKYTEVLKDIV
jgi:glycosyltransferase involved in cell wall biosynthesis